MVTFKIKNTKLYVPIVTLSTTDNERLKKEINEGFKRLIYWNEYEIKIEEKNLDNKNPARFYLGASFQGLTRLFALAFDNTDNGANNVERNSCRKDFLPRIDITD